MTNPSKDVTIGLETLIWTKVTGEQSIAAW